MIKELIEISKSIEGNILVLGDFDTKIIKVLDNNNKLTRFDHLTENSRGKGKRRFFGNKTINIKKLYKELNKQQYDYIICDFYLIKKHLNNFIYNSYKLVNKKIYFILDEEMYDYEELIRRYKRYNAYSIIKQEEKKYLITINISNMKISFRKQFIYSFRDFGYNIIEFIASIIIS